MTIRPWRLPDRYQTEPDDSWHTRKHYKWNDERDLENSHPGDKWPIVDAIERASKESKYRKAQSLAELLQHRAETALARIAEIERDVREGHVSEAVGMDMLECVRQWLIANV